MEVRVSLLTSMLRGEGCPAWCPWTCRQIPPAPSRMCGWDTEPNVSSTEQKLLAEDGARPQSMLRLDPQLSANLCGCMGAQTRTQASCITHRYIHAFGLRNRRWTDLFQGCVKSSTEHAPVTDLMLATLG